MEPIKLLESTDKITWGMPLDKLFLFSAESQCSIPFDLLGEKEICRYERVYHGISLYVTPVFKHQNGLVSLRALFEYGDDVNQYHRLYDAISSELGAPVYVLKEELKDGAFSRYPCNIWIVGDSIVEVGIREDRFVPFGYVVVTNKEHFRDIYTDKYLDLIGWDPKKQIKQ